MWKSSAAVAAFVAVVAVLPSTATAQGFTYGVSAAEVTPTSALLWAHPGEPGNVELEVALDRHFTRSRFSKTLSATATTDLTVQTRVTGLRPNHRYYYFFHQGRQRSLLGTFKTAPKPNAAQTIRFAVTGDADGVRMDGHNYWNKDGSADMATYRAMTREKNDFNVNLGDTIYSDSSPDGLNLPFANTLDLKRQRYQLNLTYPNLIRLRESGVVYNQWDDHEFVDDYTRQSQACDAGSALNPEYACDIPGLYPSGVEAFREYMPVTYSAADGTYRTFRWGSNLEIFILDERSFRSFKASEVKDNPAAPEPTTHVCDNPKGSGKPDPAPQLPQRIRSLFSFVYPPAKNPTRPECFAALNDPKRTMLGKRQYDTFTAAIKHSTAKWKVVINEVPIMEQPLNPYDDWMGYEFERVRLLRFLRKHVKNVVFVTTDFHTNWVNEARIHTFPEEGGVLGSGAMEFVSGGVADGLFGHEIDDFTGKQGSYKLLESAFILRQPPNGPGIVCSNMVTFGYTQLTATAKALTVAVKDNRGREIVGTPAGKACGPYVLKAK